MNARKIAYLSMLIGLSVVGRISFTFIPNVQPTTVIIIMTALYLGARNGMIVAIMSTLLSNLLMGMGVWTIGQMVAWSIIGLVSGWVGKRKEKMPFLLMALYAGIAGILYGFIISCFFYSVASGHFIAYYVAGLPFDIAHAIGNVAFYLILYPVLSKILKQTNLNQIMR